MKRKQTWESDPALVQKCADMFAGGHFDLDPCAAHKSAKASHYYTIAENGLAPGRWLPREIIKHAHVNKKLGPSISSANDGGISVFINFPFDEAEQWTAAAFDYMDEYPEMFRVMVLLFPPRPTRAYYRRLRRRAFMPELYQRASYGDLKGSPPFDSEIGVIFPKLMW